MRLALEFYHKTEIKTPLADEDEITSVRKSEGISILVLPYIHVYWSGVLRPDILNQVCLRQLSNQSESSSHLCRYVQISYTDNSCFLIEPPIREQLSSVQSV